MKGDVITCVACGAQQPDGRILCSVCTAKKSHLELLAIQTRFLPAVISGKLPLRLMRRHGRLESHIELLGYKGQAWCGILFESPPGKKNEWKGREIAFSLLADKELCVDCWQALTNAAKAFSESMTEAR